MVVSFHVENWRCIKSLDIELANVNIFLGKNSSGKSSLAHAAYLLAKAPSVRDVAQLVRDLYRLDIAQVVRIENGIPQYPSILEARSGSQRVELKIEASKVDVSGSLWTFSYILPSQRVACLKLFQSLLTQIVKSPRIESEAEASRTGFEVATKLLMQLFAMGVVAEGPALKLFFNDLISAISGHEYLGPKPLELESVGTIFVEVFPLIPLIVYKYRDPFDKSIELPLPVTPDGIADTELIKRFVSGAVQGSLVVVEEPENFKHPLLLVELVRDIIGEALKKNLTLLFTTHNDLILHVIGRVVEEEVLKPSQVAVYYLERTREIPWTTVRKIQVYEDGTFSEIPHVEEVLSHVF